MVIALTGEKLAGKGTAAQYLAKYYGATVYHFSGILSDILIRLHQTNTRSNLVKLGSSLRTIFGDELLAEVLYEDIVKANDIVAVIDGMRYAKELTCLQQLPNFHLISVTAPMQLRYERTKQRTEKSDEAGITLSEFQARESDSTEQGISELKQQAEVTLNNTSSIPELYQQIDALMQTYALPKH